MQSVQTKLNKNNEIVKWTAKEIWDIWMRTEKFDISKKYLKYMHAKVEELNI